MPDPTPVTRSRFEIEQDGQTSYLEFETDGHGWMTIWHTEVPKELRGRGLALELVTTAFQYAKDHNLRVDVVCPVAQHILTTHPEFHSLVSSKDPSRK
ncbi:MAG: GNAT family N-acetyltransferase [Acidobacteriaceae bacterium]